MVNTGYAVMCPLPNPATVCVADEVFVEKRGRYGYR